MYGFMLWENADQSHNDSVYNMAEGVAIWCNVGYPYLHLLRLSIGATLKACYMLRFLYFKKHNGMLIRTTQNIKVSEIPGTFRWNWMHCCWCELMPKHRWTRPAINPTWPGAKEEEITSIRSSIHFISSCSGCLMQVKLFAATLAGYHNLTWASKDGAVTGLCRRLSILSKDTGRMPAGE